MLACDATDRADIERSLAELLERFGRLDIVVNNACWREPSDLEAFEDDACTRMHSVNVDAFNILARAAFQALKAGRGNIVAISSVSGIRGDWNQFAYNATKGALNAMVQSLALDRPATPAAVARAVLFLASPHAGFITGAIIPIDGDATASSGTPCQIQVTVPDSGRVLRLRGTRRSVPVTSAAG